MLLLQKVAAVTKIRGNSRLNHFTQRELKGCLFTSIAESECFTLNSDHLLLMFVLNSVLS